MTIERITFPLADAVSGTRLIYPDNAFQHSVAGMICGLLPVSLSSTTSAFIQSNLSNILTYNSPSLAGCKTWSFDTQLGQVNAILHADGSLTAAIVDAGDGYDKILAMPLRAADCAREDTHRDQVKQEIALWLEAAEHHPPAAWSGAGPCPDNARAPWCDILPLSCEPANILVRTVLAALTISNPTIPAEEISVSIEGRQILPNGTITAPQLVMQRLDASAQFPKDIEAPMIARMADLALRNLPHQETLICQEWDRFAEQGQARLLPGVVASCDGHASSTLTAHERIAAKDFLQEGAGLT